MDKNEYNIITHELIRELVGTDYISDELADLGAEDGKLPHLAVAQHEMWLAQNADSTEEIEQYNDIRGEIREEAKKRLAIIIEEYNIKIEIFTGEVIQDEDMLVVSNEPITQEYKIESLNEKPETGDVVTVTRLVSGDAEVDMTDNETDQS